MCRGGDTLPQINCYRVFVDYLENEKAQVLANGLLPLPFQVVFTFRRQAALSKSYLISSACANTGRNAFSSC